MRDSKNETIEITPTVKSLLCVRGTMNVRQVLVPTCKSNLKTSVQSLPAST